MLSLYRPIARWRRRWRAVEPPEPSDLQRNANGLPVIEVGRADFVACRYGGCGALRPLEDVAAGAPCPGCGRV
ncbi:MAG: hypothetical protein IRZ08_01585 [Frankia sp.]|nr:hypothetical protein [Frankia sp.]